MFVTTLHEKMNEGIDQLIAELTAAKKAGGYYNKAFVVAHTAKKLSDYAAYWEMKLDDYIQDGS